MNIVVIDYGSGNLRSAAKAFERAASDAHQTATVTVSDDAEVVRRADRIVLPGQGAFADCKRGLDGVEGMVEALEEAVRHRGVPFLGICVGMQLLATNSHEHGITPGLNWIAGDVIALDVEDQGLKVPHMGWNDLRFEPGCHPLFEGIEPGAHVYFVHSYMMRCNDPADLLATVDYGGQVTAAVGRDNMLGVQFHPEKARRSVRRLSAIS